MKKITTLLAAFFCSTLLFGQANLTVTMPSPTQGQAIGPNAGFDFVITVANTGSVDLTAMDTVTFAPLVEGNVLQDQTGAPLIFNYLGPINAGSSRTDTITFSSFAVQGLGAATLEFCAVAFANGPNFSGIFGESDTTDNVDCSDVNYDPNAVSIAEDQITYRIAPKNTSYYSNGQLYIRVARVPEENVEMKVYDLNGRLVMNEQLSSSNYELKQDVMFNMSKGIYIMTLSAGSYSYGSTKFMVQ